VIRRAMVLMSVDSVILGIERMRTGMGVRDVIKGVKGVRMGRRYVVSVKQGMGCYRTRVFVRGVRGVQGVWVGSHHVRHVVRVVVIVFERILNIVHSANQDNLL
jgi:hypothetical protein